ncbi:hypothetical protein NDU88_003082 [Pleurodeles waltl]|uniref:Uncharacterized protein n=1 Tax=Pleurodeles waltl TaxID=8319 RepID=A0AAV7KTV8_PLEWA|nr:hypothetical protein NDU88_003082 [Pleurodeles waltl]
MRQTGQSRIRRQTRRPARTRGAAGARSRPLRGPPADLGCPALVGTRGPAANRGAGVPDRAVSSSGVDAMTSASRRNH